MWQHELASLFYTAQRMYEPFGFTLYNHVYPRWDLLGGIWGLQFIPAHAKQCSGSKHDPELCDAVRDSPVWYIQVGANSIPRTVSCVVDGCMGTSLQISSPAKCVPTIELQNTVEVCYKEPPCCSEEKDGVTIFPISNFYNFVCLRNLVPQIKIYFLATSEYLFQVLQ